MKDVLVIGSGISGMSCAVRCAELGLNVTLVSPFPSERAQSLMAAGGINEVLEDNGEGDTVLCHVEDTLRGGGYLSSEEEVKGLCERSGEILRFLERIGTVFSVDEGEKLCLILSVGIPDEDGHIHRSRTFEEVTQTEGDIPEWFRKGVEAALLAPTAINQQKFTFVLEKPDKVRIAMGKGPFIRVDEGILRCHFEIGAGKENFVWIG